MADTMALFKPVQRQAEEDRVQRWNEATAACRELTGEEVAAFEAAGNEYCIEVDGQEVWIVPKVSDPSRLEVTARELREQPEEALKKVRLVHSALEWFPGSRLERFEEDDITADDELPFYNSFAE